MSLLKWDESFSVNVEMIDKQHQMLLTMINDLYDAMNSGKEKDVIQKLIGKLKDYAAMHFGREEHYFKIFSYPESEVHEKEHNDFEEKVLKFENDFIEGRQSLSMEIMNFLSHWLVGHIKGSDKKYGPFFNERGLK